MEIEEKRRGKGKIGKNKDRQNTAAWRWNGGKGWSSRSIISS